MRGRRHAVRRRRPPTRVQWHGDIHSSSATGVLRHRAIRRSLRTRVRRGNSNFGYNTGATAPANSQLGYNAGSTTQVNSRFGVNAGSATPGNAHFGSNTGAIARRNSQSGSNVGAAGQDNSQSGNDSGAPGQDNSQSGTLLGQGRFTAAMLMAESGPHYRVKSSLASGMASPSNRRAMQTAGRVGGLLSYPINSASKGGDSRSYKSRHQRHHTHHRPLRRGLAGESGDHTTRDDTGHTNAGQGDSARNQSAPNDSARLAE